MYDQTYNANGTYFSAGIRFAITFVITVVLANASTQAQNFDITITGLNDLEHTRDDGHRYAAHSGLTLSGKITGYSDRFNGGSSYRGRTSWLYDGTSTFNIGLVDAEHTKNDGFKHSIAAEMNEAGQARGWADRYDGTGVFLGESVWIYDGSSTIKLGLTDAEHTKTGGYKYSRGIRMNQAGMVFGHSDRYDGLATRGHSAWQYNGTATVNIGLVDTEHTSSSGLKESEAISQNEAGYVRGESFRYNGGGSMLGRTSWVYNGSSTIKLGYTDASHTRSGGHKETFTTAMNEAGQVTGYSYRFDGGSLLLAQTPWIYTGGSTITVGLTDTEHTKSNGYNSGRAERLNEAGHVAGFSERYNGGSTYLGQSAWYYNGSSTVNVGLTGTEHTRASGRKDNRATQLNNSGIVVGYADRWNGGSLSKGRSAWYYNGSSTMNIALTDTEHTRDDGYQHSTLRTLQESGHVAGTSSRYNGGNTYLGQSTWQFDGSTTVMIGLDDVEFIRNDGFMYSSVSRAVGGFVIGDTDRYNGVADNGQSGWFYDSATGQTIDLTFSVRSSDGYAFSSPTILTEDGIVLGQYTLFDAMDNDLGMRAFYYTMDDGMLDLGGLVAGSLSTKGWEWLETTTFTNGVNQISGYGLLNGQPSGRMSYLLTQIPEPGSAGIMAIFAICILARSRRRPNARTVASAT